MRDHRLAGPALLLALGAAAAAAELYVDADEGDDARDLIGPAEPPCRDPVDPLLPRRLGGGAQNRRVDVAGSHTVQFDASDLSSGIYFYRIEAGEYIKTASMLLVK